MIKRLSKNSNLLPCTSCFAGSWLHGANCNSHMQKIISSHINHTWIYIMSRIIKTISIVFSSVAHCTPWQLNFLFRLILSAAIFGFRTFALLFSVPSVQNMTSTFEKGTSVYCKWEFISLKHLPSHVDAAVCFYFVTSSRTRTNV